ncbi:MAG: response regulator [Blastocatellia bacterium]|nr:response regulator [Blastocatellia bacterium]
MATAHPELLHDLVAEVRDFLPRITEHLRRFWQDASLLDDAHQAYRLLHTIVGDAAIVGQMALSRSAYFGETVLEELTSGTLERSPETGEFLGNLLTEMDGFVADIKEADPQGLLLGTVVAYRRLKNLPEADDEAAVCEALQVLEINEAPTVEPSEALVAGPDLPLEDEEEEAPFPELMDIFNLEAPEKMDLIAARLPEYLRHPESQRETLQEIRRAVHTLKGGANMVGLKSVAQLTHRMEDLLDRLYEAEVTFTAALGQTLVAAVDTLHGLVEGKGNKTEIRFHLRQVLAEFDTILQTEPAPAPLTAELPPLPAAVAENSHPAAEAASEAGETELYVRVPLKKLDEMVRLMSELVINRSTFERHVGVYAENVTELSVSARQMKRVTARLETEYEVATLGSGRMAAVLPTGNAFPRSTFQTEFDDLEFDRYNEFHLLTRRITEGNGDIDAIGHRLQMLNGDFDAAVNRLGRLTGELQDKLMHLRMVPFSSLAMRLERTVRMAAGTCRKSAQLVFEGEAVELDKAVIEALADPLEHMLRNAVDHGLELPDRRLAVGKAETGVVRVSGRYEGAEVVIRVTDDGAGLSPHHLREKALALGWVSESEATSLTPEALLSLIFQPGFSTAARLTEISGRGVGMDVVKATVQKLKGVITVESAPGMGTTFTLRLPMTLAVTKAFLVRVGSERYAVPFNLVARIAQLPARSVEMVGHQPMVRIEGKMIPLTRLEQALHLDEPVCEPENLMLSLLVVQIGNRRSALAVDEILSQREIVVKPLGTHIRYYRGISGATLLGDGSVVLILNPAELLQAATQVEPRPVKPVKPATVTSTAPEVLIVDDSLSVRTIVSNLMRQAGLNPSQARDGLEALQWLQTTDRLPDVILLDVEMPRMDGYELAAALRADQRFQAIPIVMLTSRAGEKHRRKAFEVGVNEYLVKPYQDEFLLSVVRQFAEYGSFAR